MGARITWVLACVCMVLLVTGCSDEPQYRIVERLVTKCDDATKDARANWINQCIANANPKSDEEPEDWLRQCQWIAEDIFCDEVNMAVRQQQICYGCPWETFGWEE